jgi:hypothetical protein
MLPKYLLVSLPQSSWRENNSIFKNNGEEVRVTKF